jgi:hypothetical protein
MTAAVTVPLAPAVGGKQSESVFTPTWTFQTSFPARSVACVKPFQSP